MNTDPIDPEVEIDLSAHDSELKELVLMTGRGVLKFNPEHSGYLWEARTPRTLSVGVAK